MEPPFLRRCRLPVPCTRAFRCSDSAQRENRTRYDFRVGEIRLQAVAARTNVTVGLPWWSRTTDDRLRRPASRSARRESGQLAPSGRIERPQPSFVDSALGPPVRAEIPCTREAADRVASPAGLEPAYFGREPKVLATRRWRHGARAKPPFPLRNAATCAETRRGIEPQRSGFADRATQPEHLVDEVVIIGR